MPFEVLDIPVVMSTQQLPHYLGKAWRPAGGAFCEHGAKSHVENLTRIELLQYSRQVAVAYLVGQWCAAQLRRDVIRGAVSFIALAGKGIDRAEECGIDLGEGAQRFEIAGACRLDMNQPACLVGYRGIHAELIRAGVQAQLVW